MRLLTEDEEWAIKLVHDDFEGLTYEEAATEMCMPLFQLLYLLSTAEEVAPQMFPLQFDGPSMEQFDLKRHEHRIVRVF